MSKPSNDNPNKIQGVEITALSVNPLIGIMMLDTDNGPLELAINEAQAIYFLFKSCPLAHAALANVLPFGKIAAFLAKYSP